MRHLIILLLILVTGPLRAQTTYDQIHKVDKAVIQAIVDEIGDAEIIYYLPKDTGKHNAQRIAKQLVWKIVYENGETEMINRAGAAAPAVAKETQTAPPAEAKQPVAGEKEVAAAEPKKPDALSKLSVTAGIDGNYLLGSEFWTAKEEGVGWMTLLGGSVRGNYQFGKSFAAFLALGYSQTSVKKNFMADEELLYESEVTMAGPHAGLGIKYFVKENIYVLAQGKGNFLKIKSLVRENGEEMKENLNAACPSLGIGLGITKKISRIVVEAELHYQFMKSGFEDATDPFHMVGARVGVGLASFGKK